MDRRQNQPLNENLEAKNRPETSVWEYLVLLILVGIVVYASLTIMDPLIHKLPTPTAITVQNAVMDYGFKNAQNVFEKPELATEKCGSEKDYFFEAVGITKGGYPIALEVCFGPSTNWLYKISLK